MEILLRSEKQLVVARRRKLRGGLFFHSIRMSMIFGETHPRAAQMRSLISISVHMASATDLSFSASPDDFLMSRRHSAAVSGK